MYLIQNDSCDLMAIFSVYKFKMITNSPAKCKFHSKLQKSFYSTIQKNLIIILLLIESKIIMQVQNYIDQLEKKLK